MRRTIEKIKERKAITLIALVVTIVVILILAGITVGMVTSDNGILKETKNAKEQAEIDNEKSIVERAKMLAMMRSKNGAITYKIFEPALKDEAGKMSTDVSNVGDTIEVLFKDSNRYYEIDQDGNVSEPQEVVKDEYAGDITKGGRCDGSEEKAYEISCIEDLVVFSNMSNGTGIKLENGKAVEITQSNMFQNKYVVLTRNLNFKSKYSYNDSTRTDFGDLNGDDTDGNTLINEMATGKGFTPIGYYPSAFGGNFDGKENAIYNLYINNLGEEEDRGLFGRMTGKSCISDLTVTGEINSNWEAGGIVGGTIEANGTTIINCTNKVNIKAYNIVGGIAGSYVQTIKECKNYGEIEITGHDYAYGGVGGIIGSTNNGNYTINIENCINYGKVKGVYNLGGIAGTSHNITNIINCENNGIIDTQETFTNVGGILGWQMGSSGNLIILNSKNTGTLLGKGDKGGIIGCVAGTNWNNTSRTTVNNCYNIGKIENGNIGGIIGRQGTTAYGNYLYIENSYSIGNMTGNTVGNIIGTINYSSKTETKTELKNVYYVTNPFIGTGTLTSGEATLKSESEIKSQTFVDLLNSNIGTNTNWKKWKLGNDGYPTFTD